MNANYRALALLAGFGLAFATAATAATTAHAAPDTTGPTLAVTARAKFVTGQSVDDPVYSEDHGGLYFANGGALMEYTWTASDSSGICRYSIEEEHASEGWWGAPTQDYRTNATSGRYSFKADEMENSDDLTAIRVNAYDCAGNKTSVERPGSWIEADRDYGPTVPSGWAKTSCTCFIGDSVIRTSTANASLSTVVNAAGRTRQFALIMAKGPARGKASIYYDGRYVTAIDTYAATNTNRVVVWQREITGTANHTIKIVNQATSGRPRIDVDAYLRTQ